MSISFKDLEQTYEFQEGKSVSIGLDLFFLLHELRLMEEVFLVRCIIELTVFNIDFYLSSFNNWIICFYQKRSYRLLFRMLIICTY